MLCWEPKEPSMNLRNPHWPDGRVPEANAFWQTGPHQTCQVSKSEGIDKMTTSLNYRSLSQ